MGVYRKELPEGFTSGEGVRARFAHKWFSIRTSTVQLGISFLLLALTRE